MPLSIEIPPMDDLWDAQKNEFVSFKGETLYLEHSLISLSKWEAKYKKPFLTETDTEKTPAEVLDYIRFMTMNRVDDRCYMYLTQKDIDKIVEYISDPQTATTINELPGGHTGRRQIVTNEIIYAKMVEYGIPFECQKWHLNKLVTLIRVLDIRSGGEKKMSRAEAGVYQRQLNEARLAAKRR